MILVIGGVLAKITFNNLIYLQIYNVQYYVIGQLLT